MASTALNTTARIRAEDFAARYADVPFCELERGEVVHLTAGGWRHSSITFKVAYLLGEWARRANTGRVLTGEAGVVTARDPDTVRGVDVAYFSFERVPRGKAPDSFSEVAPTLAVEAVGKGQGWKKMTEKAAEYLRIGTDRVWIIDPTRNTLHVFASDLPPREYRETDTLEHDVVLPGFACRVAEFFVD
ncbi:MAG: Uma2 family endonuclease [Phycisphaerae bacterium]